MPLSGTLDVMPLSDLLQWMQSSKKDGTLTITADMIDSVLLFAEGDLVAMHSGGSLQSDMGQELVAAGLINEDQLFDALQKTQKGPSLTDVLQDSGLVNEGDIQRAHEEQTVSRVLDLFFQERGSFHFASSTSTEGLLTPHSLPATSHFSKAIETRHLLFEGIRRLDEWNRIRAVFSSDYTVVRIASEAPSKNPAWQTLNDAGHPMSCGDLCLRLRGSRFDIYQSLFRAYQLGLVAPDASPEAHLKDEGQGPHRVLAQNARVLLDERQYNEASELLLMAMNVAPDDDEIRELLSETRNKHLESLYQEIGPHLSPILSCPIKKLDDFQLSPRERYIATRLSGRWDVATLIMASPFGELETLLILNKLLHADIAKFTEH